MSEISVLYLRFTLIDQNVVVFYLAHKSWWAVFFQVSHLSGKWLIWEVVLSKRAESKGNALMQPSKIRKRTSDTTMHLVSVMHVVTTENGFGTKVFA